MTMFYVILATICIVVYPVAGNITIDQSKYTNGITLGAATGDVVSFISEGFMARVENCQAVSIDISPLDLFLNSTGLTDTYIYSETKLRDWCTGTGFAFDVRDPVKVNFKYFHSKSGELNSSGKAWKDLENHAYQFIRNEKKHIVQLVDIENCETLTTLDDEEIVRVTKKAQYFAELVPGKTGCGVRQIFLIPALASSVVVSVYVILMSLFITFLI